MTSQRQRALFWLALAASVLFGCNAPGQPKPGPGDGGGAPRRVVCLTPTATEIVAALGALDRIVGVDQFSSYPPSVETLPKVGDFVSPNVEAILALTPDIVVGDDAQRSQVIQLESKGIHTIVTKMQTVGDVHNAIRSIADALAVPEAGVALVSRLEADLAATDTQIAAAIAAGRPRPRVLLIVDRQLGGLGQMIAAGPDTYFDELLRRAHAVNVLADSPARYARISIEEVLARRPDVILDAVHTADVARARTDWNALPTVPAVAKDRVYVLGDTIFVTPGPRLGQAYARLAALLYP